MTSRRFEELEKRALKIQKIRIVKTIFFAGLFSLSLSSYLYFSKNYSLKITEKVSIPQPVIEKEPIQELINTPLKIELKKEEYPTLTLSPTIEQNASSSFEKQQYDTLKQIAQTNEDKEKFLLQNFEKNHDFETAHSLMLLYFHKKHYEKAIYWSQEAITLNPASDQPWIFYAKSNFYTGQRNEAIRSLEIYLKHFNTQESTQLLNFYKGQQ